MAALQVKLEIMQENAAQKEEDNNGDSKDEGAVRVDHGQGAVADKEQKVAVDKPAVSAKKVKRQALWYLYSLTVAEM